MRGLPVHLGSVQSNTPKTPCTSPRRYLILKQQASRIHGASLHEKMPIRMLTLVAPPKKDRGTTQAFCSSINR